jgi:demethylmenaquinone methyltransferase / 2-methoxy-6-polyprenyl-1,4-benzoquinol methylase
MASPAAERTAAGVRAMFDRVAPRYDLANTVLSFGQDRGWRQAAARATRLAPGELALDVACGTGGLTRALARLQPEATVLGSDFSVEMLRRAPTVNRWPRSGRILPGVGADGHDPMYLAADALMLPFGDASLDVVTIAFGLRNLPDPDQGLREFRRVLRPGGRVLVCEFSRPTAPVFSQAYDRYLVRVLPRAARWVASDAEAYQYLARSIGAWPDQAGLARRLRRVGFTHVQWRDLTGGIVALHRGVVA